MPFPEKQLEYLLVNLNSWHKYGRQSTLQCDAPIPSV